MASPAVVHDSRIFMQRFVSSGRRRSCLIGTRSARGETGSLNKGLGFIGSGLEEAAISGLGWNLLREDLSLPSAVLCEERLRHNLDWMQRFVAAYGIKLAPHGKTTMAPKLFEMQLKSGAWGITLATAHQTE